MKLSQTAEYALRAMARLALEPSGKYVRAADLSKATHVPRAYVSKVMRRLVVAGVVDGTKGHHGGFRLVRPADQIRFSEVLAAVDSKSDDHCVFGYASCDPERPCPLHPAAVALRERITEWSEGITLADAVRDAPTGAVLGRRGG